MLANHVAVDFTSPPGMVWYHSFGAASAVTCRIQSDTIQNSAASYYGIVLVLRSYHSNYFMLLTMVWYGTIQLDTTVVQRGILL